MQIPSNGSAAMNRVDSARRSGSRPPWMMPNSAWSGPGVRREPALRPAMGPRASRRATTARGELGGTGWSKHDRDVRPERLLDGDRVLRREPVDRAVEVDSERHPVVVDPPQVAQATRPGSRPSR